MEHAGEYAYMYVSNLKCICSLFTQTILLVVHDINITCCHVLYYSSGHVSVVQYLVKEANCDPNVKDKAGETPLHKACM